jgi:large subunit ribosomal protein L23
MKLIPVITEKSIAEAKNGNYTFWVDVKLKKPDIKRLINETFAVNVVSIKTINLKGGQRKNYMGKKVRFMSKKKSMVTLREKEKIGLFEEKKKK